MAARTSHTSSTNPKFWCLPCGGRRHLLGTRRARAQRRRGTHTQTESAWGRCRGRRCTHPPQIQLSRLQPPPPMTPRTPSADQRCRLACAHLASNGPSGKKQSSTSQPCTGSTGAPLAWCTRRWRISSCRLHASRAPCHCSPSLRSKLDRYWYWYQWCGSWYQRSRLASSRSLGSGRRCSVVLVMLSARRSEALLPTFHTKVGSPLRSARAACVSVYTTLRFLVETSEHNLCQNHSRIERFRIRRATFVQLPKIVKGRLQNASLVRGFAHRGELRQLLSLSLPPVWGKISCTRQVVLSCAATASWAVRAGAARALPCSVALSACEEGHCYSVNPVTRAGRALGL
jgi:hypothetical protein